MTDADYADAFREAGIDVASLPPAEAGAKIEARPSAVRVSLATAIDDWAAVRRDARAARRVRAPTHRGCPSGRPRPWRNRLRELLQTPLAKTG